jgi:hypothetical protein
MPEFPETTVTWELEKIEPNKTRVELTHLGFIRRERNDIPLKNMIWVVAYFINELEKYCKKGK